MWKYKQDSIYKDILLSIGKLYIYSLKYTHKYYPSGIQHYDVSFPMVLWQKRTFISTTRMQFRFRGDTMATGEFRPAFLLQSCIKFATLFNRTGSLFESCQIFRYEVYKSNL